MPSTFALQLVTDLGEMAACEPLFREYMDWLVGQLRDEHQIILPTAEVEQVHADFRAEWPKLVGPQGRVIVAAADGVRIGVGTLKPIVADEVELKRLFVRPTQRCGGVGRAILERLIDEARGLGFRTMRLETFAFMGAALNLYRSVGFVETPRFGGIEGANHGTTGVELFMRLALTGR